MRRLLLPAALLAALAAGAVLWPSWTDGTWDSRRAGSRGDVSSGAHSAATAGAPGASGGATAGEGSSASARVRGVVTGPMGVLWGARVVAYHAGTRDVLAETHTSPEGAFALDVEGHVAFDLAVEPADITGLLPWRRESVVVPSGGELEEAVALCTGGIVRGRLVDENGDPVSGIVLRAVPESQARVEGPSAPGVFTPVSRAAGVAKSQREGVFKFRGLPPGRYVLEELDESWMFPAPVSLPADGPDVELVVVPCVRIDLLARNIETGDPVPAFTVRATSGDLVLLEAAGKNGAISTQVRLPGQLPPRERLQAVRLVSLDVAAPGFRPFASFGTNQVAWMIPVRDRNTTIRVSFDDGNPYLGELGVTIKSKTTGGVGRVPFERDPKTGAFRGALPWGDWDVTILPSGVFEADRCSAEARTGAGLDASLEVTLPGGGTILFSPPPGADHAIAYMDRIEEESRVLANGMSVTTRSPVLERPFAVPREGARVGGIPPGTYRIGVSRKVEVAPGHFIPMTHWVREITIDKDSVEQITLPE